jgi:hypothetical protein
MQSLYWKRADLLMIKKSLKWKRSNQSQRNRLVFTPNLVDPSIPLLNSQTVLDSLCLTKEVCILTFLTHEPEFQESTNAKVESLSILHSVKKHFYEKDTLFDFYWVNALEHGQALIRDFSVSDGYPSMIAFFPQKKQFKLLRSAFEEKSIIQFLESVGGKLKYSSNPILDSVNHTEL